MKTTLKEFQVDAVRDVLSRLRKARRDFVEDGERTTFSLSATTGSGKTVVAAAAIEALFLGDDAFDFDPDPTAVVLWFTDDPSLNAQTRAKFGALRPHPACAAGSHRDDVQRREVGRREGLFPQQPEVGEDLDPR